MTMHVMIMLDYEMNDLPKTNLGFPIRPV
jgi:hypothetical protein